MNRASGFTLIELMLAVTIVGVVAVFALPSLDAFVAKQRLRTATSDMHTTLALARSEALKRNAPVNVVPANAANWAQGWTIRSGTTVINQQDAYSNVTFEPRNAAYAAKTVTSITFQGTGREGSTDGVAFILTIPDKPSIDARCVVLDPSGRPTIRTDRDQNAGNGC